MTPIIRKYVKQGSIIYTDCWKRYADLHLYYSHLTVNHTKCFKDPNTNVHINTIEVNWSPSKQTLQKYGEQKIKFICF